MSEITHPYEIAKEELIDRFSDFYQGEGYSCCRPDMLNWISILASKPMESTQSRW